MKKRLELTLGGNTFRADMFFEEAPKTCAAIEATGGFDSIVFAANVCSNEITWNTPCGDLTTLENKVLYEDPGSVVFYPPWGAICTFFGPTEPVGWCTKFAQIIERDRDAYAEEASKVWFGQGGIVSTKVIEAEV
jgi:hypothetical protein